MNTPNSIIRNSAKAIIIRDGCVLLVRVNDEGGEWYVLPGGGQRHGESLHETVRRECLEEIGVEVEVGELRLVREYIPKNHGTGESDGGIHRVEFMFECQIAPDAVPSYGAKPDAHQTGILWVPLVNIAAYTLYPTGLAHLVCEKISKLRCVYMSDVA